MFENIMNFFKKLNKKETKVASNSKEAAKERLHLVLMQDRANVSADFLELMKQEIIEVIKKYIDVDESAIDVRLTNKENGDGTNGAPALYANIPILKNEARKVDAKTVTTEEKKSDKKIVEKENKKDKKDNNIENKQEEEKIEEDKSKKSNSETEEATDLNVDVKTKKTEEKIKSED